MSTAVPVSQPERIVTLQDIANFADSGHGTLEQVAKALTKPIDIQALRKVVRYIDRVTEAKWKKGSRRKKAEFISAQNRRKGKLFENLIGIVLESCHTFRIYGNVQTLTNEIDWLAYLAPLSILVTPMRFWGTHVLCECKMTKNSFNGNWVTRLYALTQTHGTPVAILFTSKEVGNTGGSAKPQRAIFDYAIIPNPGFILRVSLDELIQCIEAGNSPIALFANRYVELRARRNRVGLITN